MKGRTDNAIKNRYISLEKSDMNMPDKIEEKNIKVTTKNEKIF